MLIPPGLFHGERLLITSAMQSKEVKRHSPDHAWPAAVCFEEL
jgi:hypothetical protein